MQAAAQDFTIPLQPIERSPAFEPLPPTPITAWWQGVVARHEGRIAVIANRGEARYADIEAQSAAMAKGLLALGLGKGARVGVILPNGTDWIVAWLAVSRIGGSAVALSPLDSPAELHYKVHHADCAVFLTAAHYF